MKYTFDLLKKMLRIFCLIASLFSFYNYGYTSKINRTLFSDKSAINWNMIIEKNGNQKIFSSSEINSMKKVELSHSQLNIECEKPKIKYNYKEIKNFYNNGEEQVSFGCKIDDTLISSDTVKCSKNYPTQKESIYGDKNNLFFKNNKNTFKIIVICVIK